ncbi:tRNA (N6-isopentenyl adenosine(37)-C2)-methylthiotransferase MiaB [Pseudenhygromyxa sp. WMMC2535]|uniref:tRNA (N6-isopentenyl adenosine(37)-C2)-methylthiotransferase MiaB n=1 Tax=Pseudenhygromyxa sp. WMMC2535 TaxID=2712867 RepID=UPI001551DFC9|nr:tRNA (N6-isopentenyl adenosine(37)-C2)-methylthiotransferase MiaB [Pseudenhygromyxa sp. WMMC2535]NVB40499.1 tRNA (N6-isopentenyl adenosine(37)-C2)-methylthiotransferase MiaB [Pseudenhygromyxa sp. WMMC2535]
MTSLVQIRRPGAPDPAQTRDLEEASEPAAEVGPDSLRIYMETFGCQMNEADTALVLGRLQADGWVRVDDPGAADLVLVNTCAVREKAESRVYGRTSQLLEHRSRNPNLVIGITGCMAEHLRDKLETRAPHVRLVAGPDSYRNIAALARQAVAGERAVDVALDKTEVYEGLDGQLDHRGDGISSYVTIQRGCDKFCTFCVVPFTRGRERGVPPREVLRQVRRHAAAGVREITLLGQTVNSYAWEDVDFAALLRAVAAVEGIERVRFTSPYPVDFSPAVIEVLASEPKVCPYVHMPVQSGSDPVLARMRRGYTLDEYRALVDRLRAAVPDIAISTDLMVGFCGETEEDHRQTLALMEAVEFDFAFMFAYSDREITYASKKLEDDVPHAVKQRRLREVIALQERHTRAKHAARVGTRDRVLVVRTTKRGDKLLGRTPHFRKVLLPLGCAEPGEIVDVEITASTGHSLHARRLTQAELTEPSA